jgi:hypothetical protein
VYADDGQLVSRKLGKDALVTDPAKAAEQAVRMADGRQGAHDHGKVSTPRSRPSASTATARLREDRCRGARGLVKPAPSSSPCATGSGK